MAAKIDHLVVLMMENRSFDHMLGFLKTTGYDIDGLSGTETNPDNSGASVRVSADAHYAGDFRADPGHDFISVNEQIFGNSQGTGGGPFMQGFVKAYFNKTKNVAKSHNVMRCFNPSRLPALTTLAQEFAICDHWFASVPGPTLPNRAFAFGATSLGRVDMNPNYLALKTVFQLLNEQGVSSRIYYTDWSVGLANGFILNNAKKFLYFFDDFIKDCKNNKLPAYSFIEPRFNDFSDRGDFYPAADQHPDHNVFQGEKVIKAVYDAIRKNPQTWNSTLLVITYDEHGGLFDHVTPPATVSPGDKPPGPTGFNFERLGVRVPAVLISPYIPRGTIVRKVFDHSSLIATARKLFISSPNVFLTERDRQANTFEESLTLSAARRDNVKIPQPSEKPLPQLAVPAAVAVASPTMAGPTAGFSENAETGDPAQRPMNEFQQMMVQHAFTAETSDAIPGKTNTMVSGIQSEQDAAEYLAEVNKLIRKTRKKN
jgi:phospholipase C